MAEIDTLGDKALRLVQDLRVDDREVRGVELDVVFQEDDGLDADRLRVVVDVEPVLERFDDGDDQPVVALPDEDLVEDGGVVVCDDLLALAVVIGQQDDRSIQAAFAHALREPDGVHVLDVQGRDDQVERAFLVEDLHRLGAGRDVRELGRVAQVESLELLADQLVEPPVFLEQVLVIEACDQEDVADLEAHQFPEALDARSFDVFDVQVVGCGHGPAVLRIQP